MDTQNSQTAEIAEKNPWDRLEEEPTSAYLKFWTYLSLGPNRSMRETCVKIGKVAGYSRVLEQLSSDYNWVARARAWDEHNVKIEQKALVSATYDTVYQEGISKGRTVREAARVGYFDLRRVAQWDSEGLVLKNSNELSEEESAAIKRIKFNKKQGLVEIEAHDKMKGVELLGKNQKAWGDDERPSTTNNYAIVIAAVQRGDYDALLNKVFPDVELAPAGMFSKKG